MKIVLQRVKNVSVTVSGEEISGIGPGLLLLVGIARGDDEAEAKWLVEKVSGLRVFADEDGKMNLNVREAEGAILAVSQFTLLADTRKGKRPSFVEYDVEKAQDKIRAAGLPGMLADRLALGR